MPEVISQSYPYFERGLPLRSADLNNLVRYLESEDRHTRTLLIGSGCMYGLGLRLELTGNKYKLILEKGVGVTSLGYMLAVKNDDENATNKEFELGTIAKVENLSTLDFTDKPAEVIFDDTNRDITKEDLLTDTYQLSVGGGGINKADLQAGYNVVLLYSLNGDRSLSGCQNCDKTLLAKAGIQLLLVSDADLTKIHDSLGLGTGVCPDKDTIRFQSTDYPFMPRFQSTGSKDTYEHPDFVQDYRTACTQGLQEIKTALNDLNSNVVIQKLFGFTLPVANLNDLSTKLTNNTFPANNIQYAYAYIRDLIRAYEELVETPFGEIINLLPDEKCFPRHLILGKIKKDANNNLILDNGLRTPLYLPPFTSVEDPNLKYAEFLYTRLKILLENIQLINLPNNGVRITPSSATSALLGMQAIPYYYNISPVLPGWNFFKKQSERLNSIPNYLRNGANEPFNKPLKYQTDFDKADFYRIEGHTGKKLTELQAHKLDHNGNLVDSEFHQLRKNLNLPFQIRLCGLDSSSSLNHKPITPLAEYREKNPGIEHQGGVPKGGTFIIVVEQILDDASESLDHVIVGDFCLPYYDCCKKEEAPIAEFIVESPNVFEIVRESNMIVYIFSIPGENSSVHVFFKNISENADEYKLDVTGKPSRKLDPEDLAFDETFQYRSTDYEVKLTATRDDVSDGSIKKIRFKVAPPVAEFVVESPNDFEIDQNGVYVFTVPDESASLHIFFKNISENADKFTWQVNDETPTELPATELVFNRAFPFSDSEYTVKLTAKRGVESDVDTKNIRFKVVPPPPVIAEYIVESPNDFEIDQKGDYVFNVPEGTSTVNIFFKSISENADILTWTVLEGVEPVAFGGNQTAFNYSKFNPSKTYSVKLAAKRQGQPDAIIEKTIRFNTVVTPVEPLIAEFIVESPNDFTMSVEAGREVYTFKRPSTGKPELRIFFKSVSENADTFEWKVDNKPAGDNHEAAFNHNFDFSEKESYTVSLRASHLGQTPHTVSKIVRIEQGVIADFVHNREKQQLAIFVAENPVKIKGKDTVRVILQRITLGTEVLNVPWTNTSSASADAFLWKAFREGETKPFAQKETNDRSDFVLQLLQPDDLNSNKDSTFIIELNATNTASGITDQKNVFLTMLLPPPALESFKEAAAPVAPASKKASKAKTKPEAAAGSEKAKSASAPPANTIQNLRTRHRDYRTEITGIGKGNALLAKTKGYKNAIAFLDSSDDVETLSKSFKDLATQFIRNIKLEGGVPDEVYQALLKNLIFFCFDKLSFLQPAGLTPNVKKAVDDVFARMKKEKTFPSLAALRKEWKSADVLSADNAAVIKQLDALLK